MGTAGLDDPILKRLRAALDAAYGDRLQRVVLYGSRARGEAGPVSDYDVAVFLHNMTDTVAESYRLADLGTQILYDTGEFVHAFPFRAGAYEERTPIMHEIRRDGVDL